jgi:hypothetical protein
VLHDKFEEVTSSPRPDTPDPASDVDGVAGGGSLTGGLRALLDDAQTLVEAELGYQQARIAYGWGRAKGVVALLLLSLAFGFFTLVALVVGLLLALTPILGAWGSLAVVGLGLGLLATLCFLSAVGRFRKARAAILGEAAAP